jgi:hypothetical protein
MIILFTKVGGMFRVYWLEGRNPPSALVVLGGGLRAVNAIDKGIQDFVGPNGR